jgi:predicted DCC family thiol-disulfide oxidoreductase YuxK
MATLQTTSEKFLTYDGDCPMCIATVGGLIQFGLVRADQTRSNHDLAPEIEEQARAAGIRNQLVVFDPQSGATRVGSDGLLWIIGDTPGYRAITTLLGLPVLRQLLRFGYEAISYNRRIISPPKHRIVCDCEPEVTAYRRLTLIVPLVLMCLAIVALFGAACFAALNLGNTLTGAGLAMLTVGVAGGILAVSGLVLLRGEQRLDYVAQLAVTLFAGSLLLLPASLLAFVLGYFQASPVVTQVVAGLSIVASIVQMVRMQLRRVAAVGLSKVWLAAFAIVLPATCLVVYLVR